MPGRHRLAMVIVSSAFAASCGAAELPPPQGVLNLRASATVELPQDWMTLTLAANRDGADAASVQAQLKQALDAALGEARRQARPGQVEVQTGGFSIYPRYNAKGVIGAWQGTAELVVQGRDMVAIGQLAGRIGTMSVARVGYSLSREARETVESEVTHQAIQRFRARASDDARQFGYAGYQVRELSVAVDSGLTGGPAPAGVMAMARLADAAPLPVEAGKGSVTATVSGSIQMQ